MTKSWHALSLAAAAAAVIAQAAPAMLPEARAEAGADESCALQLGASSSFRSKSPSEQVPAFVPNCSVRLTIDPNPVDVRVQGVVRIPDEVRRFIQYDSMLPEVNQTGLFESVVVYPGTIYIFSTLAKLSYCGDGQPVGGNPVRNFSCPSCVAGGFTLSDLRKEPGRIFFQNDATHAYVGKIEPTGPTAGADGGSFAPVKSGCLVSFQGSDSIRSWFEDFQFWLVKVDGRFNNCPTCSVHRGFWNTWESYAKGVLHELEKKKCKQANQYVYLTGHSLGGAIATVAALVLQQEGYNIGGVITFEAPRAGNPAFQQRFNEVLADALLYRVTYHKDIVPHVPPRIFDYQHWNPEIFYDTTDLHQVKVCPKTEDPSCSDQFSTVWTLLNLKDHCGVPYDRDCDICLGCESKIFGVV